MIETAVHPRGPYSLRVSARGASDATRISRDGRIVAAFDGSGSIELGAAWQRSDGAVVLRAPSEQTLERLRFTLALEDDHSEFLARFKRDDLLGPAIRELPGLRPLRVATVAQALLRALCGQLVDTKTARSLEWRIVKRVSPRVDRLHAPPRREALARFAPAELCRLGLAARKGATLVRICRDIDVERLRELPTEIAAQRIERERGLGPWSAGTICLQGLGRYERGLVGDLSLIKLSSALRGRWVEAWETEELLAPYGEWAGLASVYMLAGAGRGLIAGANGGGVFLEARRVRTASRKAANAT